ncbi:hypothetical protein M408DRAFT_329975 [Serendipita vermifera MAFF 305830]|uniref:Exportin-T n=1 Tax=Serendipita vermifera MAFF 305830 TaxID=933852 RepID=A0A0C3ASJ9_SERVB|nr:hypothetical protein M408DRAFT_329975 [Serendipita vermifera MAFF 305830]
MSSPEEQIVNAITIAQNPNVYGGNHAIHSQAIEFLAKVRAESAQSWRPALSLFLAVKQEDPSKRQFGPDVRIFALSVLGEFLDMRTSKGPLAPDDFATLKEQFLNYLKSEYLYGQAESEAPFIRNKFSHVLTLFFLASYETQWLSFFSDMFALLKPPPDTQIPPLNAHISIFFFKLVQEISAEVADQLIKNARSFTAERMARDGRVRDLVRERDAQEINAAVFAIVVDAKTKLDQVRVAAAGGEMASASGNLSVEERLAEDVVELGIRAFASYVQWIDINLTVTPDTITLLFSLLSDLSLSVRLAATGAITKIVGKGLKVPSDKLKLMQVLSLGPVLHQLQEQTAQLAKENYTEALMSFRNALAHLANALGVELVALCQNTTLAPDEIGAAAEMLEECMPTALRFLADDYDDVSLSMFPLVTEILSSYKKAKQASPDTHMTAEKRTFLEEMLGVLLDMLKWDEDDEPEIFDEDDIIMFENTRKDVRKIMDMIYVLDNDLVTSAISQQAQSALDLYEGGANLPWNQAELAIYLVFMYGELGGKDKGKGRAAFCMAPSNIPKEQRKTVDYSEYPLTPQGEMMQTLIRSGISTYPNPTVAMQFFETVARYVDFFKVRKENVLPALEAFLDNRGIHHPSSGVRKRVFYLFFRFVQSLRTDIDIQHVPPILQAIQDLMTFDVELPKEFELPELYSDAINQDTLATILKEPTTFDAQLYMFEAAGALVSTLWSLPEHQANALRSVTAPLLSRLSAGLQTPIPVAGAKMSEDDFKTVLAVHHCIQALGSIPKGFPEYPSPVPPDYIPPPLTEFRQMADAILVSLDVMGRFRVVREAARFAFGRIIFAAGPSITEYIPRLMGSLLAHFDSSEFVDFIGFISHMTHKLQAQFTAVLEEVFAPLTTHVSSVIAKPITGTDDKVVHVDTKKAFLSFLSTIMSSNLGGIIVSQNNLSNLQPFLETVLQMASDPSDALNQKLALAFVSRFISVFGHPAPTTNGNGSAPASNSAFIVPGIEQFIYQRILLVAFSIPFHPDFNLKDAQSLATLQEVANLLQTIVKVRGDEALTYISTVFLPSQNVPTTTAMELTNSIRALDKRTFQKYLTDFVKASRSS